MNDISLIYKNIEEREWENNFLKFIETVLKELAIDNWEFSVTLCDDAYISIINKDYREKDGPTDVITFVMSDDPFPVNGNDVEPYSAGDIIISLDSVYENAKYFVVNKEEELKRVIIHGILHLKGYDHATNEKDEEMLIFQEEILKRIIDQGIY